MKPHARSGAQSRDDLDRRHFKVISIPLTMHPEHVADQT